MKYRKVVSGTFKSRPNRFIAMVDITEPDAGKSVKTRCHVKNTGKCKEPLY